MYDSTSGDEVSADIQKGRGEETLDLDGPESRSSLGLRISRFTHLASNGKHLCS